MPRIPMSVQLPTYQLAKELYSQAAIAISQAQVKLKTNFNDATTGSLKVTDIVQPFAGSIVGVTLTMDTNKTAGLLQVSPSINGTEVASTTPLYRVAMANAAKTKSVFSDAQVQGQRFNAGDTIGAIITTDSNLLPAASADLYAEIWVVYDFVQA